jgi:short-subunit dehydrogenase
MNQRPTALITGASGGLGAAFAHRLAKDGFDLILVDKCADPLIALAGELRQAESIAVETLVADLAEEAGMQAVEQRIAGAANLEMLVNNAGFGLPGDFVEVPVAKHLTMISVHVIASVRFCHAAIPGMIARGPGTIINVASLAALLRLRGCTTYTSTKAYLLAFSECLQTELAGTGVRVQALCPGWVATGFFRPFDAIGFDHQAVIPKILWLSADRTVDSSLRALRRGKVRHVPLLRVRLFAALLNSSPGKAAMAILGKIRRSRRR